MDQVVVINIFLGFAGFILSLYIFHKKRRKEHMVCPLRGNCKTVIHSKFSQFLGIPVEILGMVYYAAIASGYGISMLFPSIAQEWPGYALLFVSGSAFLFSLYLTFIQLFTLRNICTWCLLSAALTTFIFITAFFTSLDTIFIFLRDQHEMIVLFHGIAAAIGLGAATIADITFFKFLKDFRISKKEASVLELFSQIIWVALGVLIMTGVGLYLPQSTELLQTPKFLAKITVLAILVVNGAILNLIVTPRLVDITFGKEHSHRSGELRRGRQFAFALGPISLISWYTVFILGALRSVDMSYQEIMSIYAVLLLAAIIGAEIFERILDKRADKHKPRPHQETSKSDE